MREVVRHARFRLMSDVDAGIDDSRPRCEAIDLITERDWKRLMIARSVTE